MVMDTLFNDYYFVIDIGDRRMVILADMIRSAGGKVFILGEESYVEQKKPVYCLPPFACLDEKIAVAMLNDSIVFCRLAYEDAKRIVNTKGVQIFTYDTDEILVMQNAFLTAEGTLAYLISNTDCTIRNLKVLVLGLGRVGKSLLTILKDNYVRVSVASQPLSEQALGYIMAEESYCLDNLKNYIDKFDVIINSIPKLIIQGEELKKTRKGALIIDLASSPGGVDYTLAKAMGINAVHYPGVPGKTAPYTAAEYIRDSIMRKLTKEIYE